VFGEGSNSAVTATTDENGNFAVMVPVDSNERGGDRTIVVQSASGAAASAPVEVIEDEQIFVGLPGFGLG
jgi:phosphatidate phosphatase APP1